MVVGHAAKLHVERGTLIKELGQPFKIFSKYVRVFDLYFVATETSPDEKLLHGASVLYQYIDNDDDGVPDNKDVYNALVKLKGTMIMFKDEKEHEANFSFYKKNDRHKRCLVQDLQSDETRPGSTFPHKFDASLEECFHLVTVGYAEAYTKVFGLKRGSLIANAMDKARGGYFKNVPKKYPDEAWFTYYDKTCDYESMIVEYIYWVLTSMLDLQKHRGEEISDEWKLYTPHKVEYGDPAAFSLLSNPSYKFPTKAPVAIDVMTKYDVASESSGSESDSSAEDRCIPSWRCV